MADGQIAPGGSERLSGSAGGAGNGIVSGTPFENIAAFLDEAVRYGAKHRGMVG